MSTRHLDVGCGLVPRNPFGQTELYAVDLVVPAGVDTDRFRRANLALEAIPFPDSSFDSVSAFDFLEHIPRVLGTRDGQATRFPFVELMNEFHRVLRPGGRLYAVTPAFPRPEAFVDPTHVNTIAFGTARYFCEPDVAARVYGFRGAFTLVRNEWALFPEAFSAAPIMGWWRRFTRWRKLLQGHVSHLVWEFECLKPETQGAAPRQFP
jgi:SAM-dependent methyltransferase